jgi:hypothetical protein
VGGTATILHAEDVMLRESHSLLGLRVWLAGQPLRLAPAWAVLCGALASGRLRWSWHDGLALVLAVILADGLWGQMWMLLSGSAHGAKGPAESSSGRCCRVPYAVAYSPADRVAAWLRSSPVTEVATQTALWGQLLLVLVFCVVVALSLGAAALVPVAAALLLAGLSRLVVTNPWGAALSQAGFEIGLPWLLGHVLFAGFAWSPLSVACGLAYVLWMSLSLRAACGLPSALMVLVCAAPLACLVIARQPMAAGIFGATLLPTLAMVSRGVLLQAGSEVSARHRTALQPWWWAGMVVASWGLGMAAQGR